MCRSRPPHRATVLFALTLLLAGCGDASRDGGVPGSARVETADSAGITIIRSSSPDRPLSLGSQPALALGGKDTPEESFFQVRARTVASDGEGNLHVLDPNARQVQVFDSTGRHLRRLGGQGGGPGELQLPLALAVDDDGRVWVADPGKRGLVHWDADGRVLPSDPFPQGYFGGGMTWTSSGLMFLLRDVDGRRLIVLSESGETEVLASLPSGETRPFELSSCGLRLTLEPIFVPNLVWTARGTRVVVGRNPEYVLDVYEDGRLVKSLRRDVPMRPASEALARASLGDGMRVLTSGGERTCDPDEQVEKQGFAPYVPTVARLALAPDGALWVERYTVGDEPGSIDLFDTEGAYRGTLPAGSPFPIGFLPDGRIFVSERDKLDVERLVVRTAEVLPDP